MLPIFHVLSTDVFIIIAYGIMLNINMFLTYGKMLFICAYCIHFSTFPGIALAFSPIPLISPLQFPPINARIPFRIYGLCRKGYGYEFTK